MQDISGVQKTKREPVAFKIIGLSFFKKRKGLLDQRPKPQPAKFAKSAEFSMD